MKKILILGATSLIAEECCKIWAKNKCELFLVGRDIDRLKAISNNLRIRYECKIDFFQLDLVEIENHEKCFSSALNFLKKIDTVLIAHGSLSDEIRGRKDVSYALKELKLNAKGSKHPSITGVQEPLSVFELGL